MFSAFYRFLGAIKASYPEKLSVMFIVTFVPDKLFDRRQSVVKIVFTQRHTHDVGYIRTQFRALAKKQAIILN